MALLEPEVLEQSLNLDLSDPNGSVVATEQIAAAVSLAETSVGYHLEQAKTSVYLPDPARHIFLPTAAPVYDAAEKKRGVMVEKINTQTLNVTAESRLGT